MAYNSLGSGIHDSWPELIPTEYNWIDYFEKYERLRNPMLSAMADREESLEAFAEARTTAETEEERLGRATRNCLLRELRRQVRRLKEDGQGGDGPVDDKLVSWCISGFRA